MWVRIDCHWEKCQSEYLKEATFRKKGLNWERFFIEKILQTGNEQ